jgi:hypothetical protein
MLLGFYGIRLFSKKPVSRRFQDEIAVVFVADDGEAYQCCIE